MNNNYAYLGYSFNDLQCLTASQLWAGGGHGFLGMSTNGGGAPIPQAFFKVDTTGYYLNGTVNLANYSRKTYTYRWNVNGTAISSGYNASYIHDINNTTDTIQLIVSNGLRSDTLVRYHNFYPPVIISSFEPASAGAGYVVTIRGSDFSYPASVSFGGVPAAAYTVESPAIIKATVDAGASSVVAVTTSTGRASLAGFTFIPPPVISSFDPIAATAGSTVTIKGSNFNDVSQVSFGGVDAAFTVLSPTTITAIVPSGQSGDVKVTTSGGTFSLSGFIALPTVKSFTPLKGTEETVLTITGTSFTETKTVTVGGINVKSFTINNSTSISAVVSTGATGNVKVTTNGGNASLGGFTWFPAGDQIIFSGIRPFRNNCNHHRYRV